MHRIWFWPTLHAHHSLLPLFGTTTFAAGVVGLPQLPESDEKVGTEQDHGKSKPCQATGAHACTDVKECIELQVRMLAQMEQSGSS